MWPICYTPPCCLARAERNLRRYLTSTPHSRRPAMTSVRFPARIIVGVAALSLAACGGTNATSPRNRADPYRLDEDRRQDGDGPEEHKRLDALLLHAGHADHHRLYRRLREDLAAAARRSRHPDQRSRATRTALSC